MRDKISALEWQRLFRLFVIRLLPPLWEDWEEKGGGGASYYSSTWMISVGQLWNKIYMLFIRFWFRGTRARDGNLCRPTVGLR
jgi:hypothetical protein